MLPVLTLRSASPRSFTGEDALELYPPGNPWLVQRILTLFCTLDGVRAAAPGEFSARAFLAGKLTLEQAEGIAASIRAATAAELSAAEAVKQGKAGSIYREVHEEIAALLALVEAGIDFTDQEDVVAIHPKDLSRRVRALKSRISALIGASGGEEHVRGLPRIAIVGRPNAGKSTLFNALLGRERAVASPVIGTTRDVLREEIDLAAVAPAAGRVALLDLPGLDSPSHELDHAAQAAARSALSGADALLWCDPTGTFAETDLPTEARGKPTIRVRTFADRAGLLGQAEAPQADAVAVCALTGAGLQHLRRALADAALGESAGALASVVPRHRSILTLALDRLSEIEKAATAGGGGGGVRMEIVAEELRSAAAAITELTGGLTVEEVLGRIFSTFCIGK